MLRAASVPLTTDLRSLLAVLRVQGVQVRVSEEAGEQVVWARDERDVEAVAQALVALETAAIAVAVTIGISQNIIKKGLKEFKVFKEDLIKFLHIEKLIFMMIMPIIQLKLEKY